MKPTDIVEVLDQAAAFFNAPLPLTQFPTEWAKHCKFTQVQNDLFCDVVNYIVEKNIID